MILDKIKKEMVGVDILYYNLAFLVCIIGSLTRQTTVEQLIAYIVPAMIAIVLTVEKSKINWTNTPIMCGFLVIFPILVTIVWTLWTS